MKRIFLLAMVFSLLFACAACGGSKDAAAAKQDPQVVIYSAPTEFTEVFASVTEMALPEGTAPPVSLPVPEAPAVPAALFDPDAPAGDPASEGYAALMDDLVRQLRTYDGSQSLPFTATLENPYALSDQEIWDFYDTLFLHTIRENPEFFWINLGSREKSYDPAAKTITFTVDIFPEFQGDGFQKAQKDFSHALDTVLAEIFHPGMSDMEKILSAYGWIRQYVAYDDALEWRAYSAYSCLVSRRAVCHGSAVTMNLLMQKIGIGCYTVLSYVPSMEMYHIWNAVEIGGHWYNLDPTPGHVPGYGGFNNFIRSTEEMLDGDIHYEHDTRLHLDCSQSYPGDTPWLLTTSSFLYSEQYQGLVNVENCIAQDGTLYLDYTADYRAVAIDAQGNATITLIATIPGIVYCSTQEYKDFIYYNTSEGEIRAFQISTGEDKSLTGKTYPLLYPHINLEAQVLEILDGAGTVQDTLPLAG